VKLIFVILLVVLGALAVFSIGAGLLVLASYGVGWVLTRFLPFSPFEVTVLVLAAFGLVAYVVFRIAAGLANPFPIRDLEDEDDWDEDWDDDDWDEAWDDEDEEDDDEEGGEEGRSAKPKYAGIPRWRQPIKDVDFSAARPDDRCPCGSGRKYKNCHGANKK
jgi:hypothetical protein